MRLAVAGAQILAAEQFGRRAVQVARDAGHDVDLATVDQGQRNNRVRGEGAVELGGHADVGSGGGAAVLFERVMAKDDRTPADRQAGGRLIDGAARASRLRLGRNSAHGWNQNLPPGVGGAL